MQQRVIERYDRRYPPPPPEADGPSPFAYDRDRIFHSPAFQRLRHVTQVMAVGDPGHFHNRLTHSLAVARIGRRLAETLLSRPDGAELAEKAGGIDPTVVEAACLAHDLGHPPFAHVAEGELDRLLTAAGVAEGFEANAQTFRVVCTLADDVSGERGFNLTRATLAAILKYPWQRNGSQEFPRKWGAYTSEADDLAWARAHLPPGNGEPALEAALMDWADLVAYAVYDFEDFIGAGLIPLDRLAASASARERFLALVFARRVIPTGEQSEFAVRLTRLLAECPGAESASSTRQGRNALRCFANHQVDQAIGAVALSTNGHGIPALEIAPAVKAQIFLLEGLTWHYVIDSELLVPQRDVQREIIRTLFASLAEAMPSDRWGRFLPPSYRDQLRKTENEKERLRVVADYLASLTEGEAIAIHQDLINATP